MIRTCDSCAQTGEVTVEGDAYVCRTCHNEHDEAIREVARIHTMTPMAVRRIVEDYFLALDRATVRSQTSGGKR